MSNITFNIAYLSTAQSFTKIFQLFIGIVIATLLCNNWSALPTCFRDTVLEAAAVFTVLASLINLLLFAGNLLNSVTGKVEFGASLCCALLMLLQIFAITKFVMSAGTYSGYAHLVIAMMFTALSMSGFVYMSMFALLLHRLNERRRQRPMTTAVAGGAKLTCGQPAGAISALREVRTPKRSAARILKRLAARTPKRSTEDHRASTAASPAVTGTPTPELYEAVNFQFRGSLKIPKKNQLDMTPLLDEAHEADNLPKDAALRFTGTNNLIYDIGSEVEQLID